MLHSGSNTDAWISRYGGIQAAEDLNMKVMHEEVDVPNLLGLHVRLGVGGEVVPQFLE